MQMPFSGALFWITLLIMGVGLFSLAVPILPGLTIIWLAALGYGVVSGLTPVGWVVFAFLTLLFIAGGLVDNILMGTKAHKEGASWLTVLLGMLAGVIGTLALPPFGGLIAAPLAVLLLEYLRQRDLQKALASLRGLAVGWGTAFVVRFFIGVVMISTWLLWVWFR